MGKVSLSLKQRLCKQELVRKPEMDMVMVDREQDEQFNRDGEEGSLAVLYQLIVDAITKVSPPNGRALDLGCGSAQLLCKIARALPGLNFTGLDLSEHMLAFAQANKENYGLTNLSFKHGSMYELDRLFSERFDLISCHLALHHCDTAERATEVFNQISRLVQPEGTVFIFDIIRPKTGRMALQFADLYNRMQGDWYYQDALDSYRAAFSFPEVEEMLKQSGLKHARHIEPLLGNFFQIIVVSSVRNNNPPTAPFLKYCWQKIDYQMLKLCFAGKI